MNILFIASGFPPYEFSENIINGKLVLALMKRGHSVNVISKIDEGELYNSEWQEPWLVLMPITYNISYSRGSTIRRLYEIIRNTIYFKYPQEGIRWAELAYRKAKELIREKGFEVIMTRSPSDIAHLVGLRLKKNLNIRWIANWNDPSTGIWPEPYEKDLPSWKRKISKMFTQEVLRSADKITFPSQLLSEYFKEHFKIEDERIMVIPHIMLNEQLPVQNVTNDTSIRMIHSGNMSDERDPTKVFMALEKINNQNSNKIFLDIMGVISEKWAKLIEEMELREYVNVIRPLPYFEVLQKMLQYDVLLILEAPLKKGIFLPSKISDYIQLNKPILAISPVTGEVKNLIESYGGGVAADNNSAEDILDKLDCLSKIKESNKLDEIVNNSRLHEYFGEKRIISLTEKGFEQQVP